MRRSRSRRDITGNHSESARIRLRESAAGILLLKRLLMASRGTLSKNLTAAGKAQLRFVLTTGKMNPCQWADRSSSPLRATRPSMTSRSIAHS
jgi:hypothetical protein